MRLIKKTIYLLILFSVTFGSLAYETKAYSQEMSSLMFSTALNSVLYERTGIRGNNSDGSFNLGDLYVLHQLFKESSNGFLNQERMSLGDLYVLDTLFNGDKRLLTLDRIIDLQMGRTWLNYYKGNGTLSLSDLYLMDQLFAGETNRLPILFLTGSLRYF